MLYLTKRLNSTVTFVARESAGHIMNEDERKMKTNFKLATITSTCKNNYTPDDEGWSNNLDKKEDGTIRIITENVNNVSSQKNHNLKLDNGKK